MATLLGVDVSEHQESLDMADLKSKFNFVIVRSSFGTARSDTQFIRNRDQCRSLGLLHGYYHYAYPNNNTAQAEADFFLSNVLPLEDGESLYLDFEEQYPDPVGWSLAFLQRIEQRTGYKPLIYMNLNLVNTYNWKPVVDNDNGLWLAQWNFGVDAPLPDLPWSVCAMRQYTNVYPYGNLKIDGDVFYGDSKTFKAYGFKSSQAPQLPPEEIDLQKLYDACRVDSDNHWNDLQNKIKELADLQTSYNLVKGEKEKLEQQLNISLENFGTLQTTTAKQITALTEQVNDLTVKSEELKTKIVTLESSLAGTDNEKLITENLGLKKIIDDMKLDLADRPKLKKMWRFGNYILGRLDDKAFGNPV